jgi:hypothetical protein
MCIIPISSIFVSANCNLMDSGLEMQEAIICELFTVSYKNMVPVILWALTIDQEGFVGRWTEDSGLFDWSLTFQIEF